jgi:UDP-N-acetylmuramoylalanine--D-glutamate ligase
MIDLTPYIAGQDHKNFAVFGLARSGLSTIKALIHAGAHVTAYDDRDSARAQAKKLGAQISPLDEQVLNSCAALILAPGVPLTHPAPHPVVKAAQAAGCPIISDIELLYRAYPSATYIGITGTNGKSTTTALVDHILKTNDRDSQCGGNIGVPVMDLNLPDEGGAFVLELSSYQLDLCDRFSADIAVLLNITPDHLDRHGDMANYTTSKMRIFKGASVRIAPQLIILNTDDCQWTALESRKEILRAAQDDSLGPDFPALPGHHNLENAAAALAICETMGLTHDQIIAAMKTFPGLIDRQFLVRTINGIKYVNDSKGTNAMATINALSSYEDIFWIAGGRAKDGGLEGTQAYLPRIKHAYLIGEAAEAFAAFLEKHNTPYTIDKTLDKAIDHAHKDAQTYGKGVVLLSPACSSFDQFPSYAHRGQAFVDHVQKL